MSWKDIPGIKAGVVTGDVAWALMEHAKKNGCARRRLNSEINANQACGIIKATY